MGPPCPLKAGPCTGHLAHTRARGALLPVPDHEFEDRPHQGIDAVGRALRPAIDIGGERRHLLLEQGEGADVVHPSLVVEGADRFGARHLATPASADWFWNPPPGDPGTPVYLFDGTIYDRGGMTLQALREKVGDQTFFRIMREWAQQNPFGTVTTPEFIALAERDSGMDLDTFFQAWLYQPGKPTTW